MDPAALCPGSLTSFTTNTDFYHNIITAFCFCCSLNKYLTQALISDYSLALGTMFLYCYEWFYVKSSFKLFLVFFQWQPQLAATISSYCFNITFSDSSKYNKLMEYNLFGTQHGVETPLPTRRACTML